jgi:hypothetical protein
MVYTNLWQSHRHVTGKQRNVETNYDYDACQPLAEYAILQ